MKTTFFLLACLVHFGRLIRVVPYPNIAFCRSSFVGFLALALVTVHASAQAAGVTVLTHGYNSDISSWITAMTAHMRQYSTLQGSNVTTYNVILTYSNGYFVSTTRIQGQSPLVADSGEIFVNCDWSQMAGGFSAPYDFSTYDVAPVVRQVLMLTNLITELGGHSLVEFPLHLVGHSRGGSLMTELTRSLGTNGIWVDQLTTIDPHPLNNDGNFEPFLPTDATANATYANVLFHDNVWQDLGLGWVVGDPDGEPVSGAYNRQLFDLSGGYSSYHSDTHLWYHGTVDTNTPADDTGATITSAERANWWSPYEQSGARAGFYYSLIGRGDRTTTDRPLGLPSDPAVRDGYNQWWNLGGGTSANRVPLDSNNGNWPNLIKFDITGTNAVAPGTPITTMLFYQYGGTSNLSLQVFLDSDLNPYNSNRPPVLQLQPPGTGTSNVYFYSNLSVPTTNVPPGSYWIFARITDGLRSRYLYTPQKVTLLAPQQSPTLDIAKLNSTQFQIGVTGLPNQTIIIQASPDLQSWTPLVTNILAANRWLYTNTTSQNTMKQFYRAVVAH